MNMKKKLTELQKLKGVGDVLAKRLVAAGLETFEKIAAAGEEGLKKVSGLNPRMASSIAAQAGEMASDEGKSREERVAILKNKATALKEQIQGIALSVKDRFKEEVAAKNGRKVEKEIMKVINSLEKVERKLETRTKKAGKGLTKAEKRLSGLADAGLKGIGKGLKKARKSLRRVTA